MVTRGEEIHVGFLNPVDKPVFLINSPGPASTEFSTQWLGLTQPREWGPKYVIDQSKRSQRPLAVDSCPILQVFQEIGIHYRQARRTVTHGFAKPRRARRSSISIGSPTPSAARRLASIKRRAFLGERNK